MLPAELSGPDLAGVVADADAAGLKSVVIGGFSVILRFLDLNEARRLPQDGVDLEERDGKTLEAEELEAIHGELPIDPIPGLDS